MKRESWPEQRGSYLGKEESYVSRDNPFSHPRAPSASKLLPPSIFSRSQTPDSPNSLAFGHYNIKATYRAHPIGFSPFCSSASTATTSGSETNSMRLVQPWAAAVPASGGRVMMLSIKTALSPSSNAKKPPFILLAHTHFCSAIPF